MAQNIYDRPDFFEGYGQLRRSIEGLDGAPEWPVLRAMLPKLGGLRVLDLGCGYGWFARWAEGQGAACVLGLDLSEKMLAKARDDTPAGRIRYETADLEHLTLREHAFDLVFSSLAFHYVEDSARLFGAIGRALVPGGRLVFSTEHPVFMAGSTTGWMTGGDGARIWPVSGYAVEGQRITEWLGARVVKYHRTVATTLNHLIDAGFRIRQIEEFAPSRQQIEATPSLAKEIERPMFLMVSAMREPAHGGPGIARVADGRSGS